MMFSRQGTAKDIKQCCIERELPKTLNNVAYTGGLPKPLKNVAYTGGLPKPLNNVAQTGNCQSH